MASVSIAARLSLRPTSRSMWNFRAKSARCGTPSASRNASGARRDWHRDPSVPAGGPGCRCPRHAASQLLLAQRLGRCEQDRLGGAGVEAIGHCSPSVFVVSPFWRSAARFLAHGIGRTGLLAELDAPVRASSRLAAKVAARRAAQPRCGDRAAGSSAAWSSQHIGASPCGAGHRPSRTGSSVESAAGLAWRGRDRAIGLQQIIERDLPNRLVDDLHRLRRPALEKSRPNSTKPSNT